MRVPGGGTSRPCIGVTPWGAVGRRTSLEECFGDELVAYENHIPPEPNRVHLNALHTHFILVDADKENTAEPFPKGAHAFGTEIGVRSRLEGVLATRRRISVVTSACRALKPSCPG